MGIDTSRDINTPLLLTYSVLFVCLLILNHVNTGNFYPLQSLLVAAGITLLQIIVYVIYVRRVDREMQAAFLKKDLSNVSTFWSE
jgi:hypothetical protein